jgi:hypothetical protein
MLLAKVTPVMEGLLINEIFPKEENKVNLLRSKTPVIPVEEIAS